MSGKKVVEGMGLGRSGECERKKCGIFVQILWEDAVRYNETNRLGGRMTC
jgi:hypothetical protein